MGTTAAQQTPSAYDHLYYRYSDGYKVANFIVGLGAVIKFFSVLFAILILIAVIFASLALPSRNEGAVVIAVFFCFFLGFGGYTLGVVASAHGQLVRAALDTAVNTSTLMTNEQRMSVMKLTEN